MSETTSPAQRRRRRKAITLIEVLGTLSILLVLAVSAASMLAAVTEIGIRVGADQQGRVSIERLAQQFRSDVHRADDIKTTDNAWPLELTTPTGLVRYEYDGHTGSLRRSETGPQRDSMVDEFRFPRRCDPRVVIDEQLVSLQLTDQGAVQPWIIEATRK